MRVCVSLKCLSGVRKILKSFNFVSSSRTLNSFPSNVLYTWDKKIQIYCYSVYTHDSCDVRKKVKDFVEKLKDVNHFDYI